MGVTEACPSSSWWKKNEISVLVIVVLHPCPSYLPLAGMARPFWPVEDVYRVATQRYYPVKYWISVSSAAVECMLLLFGPIAGRAEHFVDR